MDLPPLYETELERAHRGRLSGDSTNIGRYWNNPREKRDLQRKNQAPIWASFRSTSIVSQKNSVRPRGVRRNGISTWARAHASKFDNFRALTRLCYDFA
jgi:hypothetical protein